MNEIPHGAQSGIRFSVSNQGSPGWSLIFLGLLWLLVGIGPVQAAENQLKAVNFSVLPGNSVKIQLTADGPVDEPKVFTTDNPARIALDFYGMASALEKKNVPIGVGLARSVTAVEAGGRTRVVINLVGKSAHEIKVVGNQVFIEIDGVSPIASRPKASSRAVAAKPRPVVRDARNSIENVDFRRGDAGEGRIILQFSDPSTVVDMREEGGRIVLDLFDVVLPEKFMRKFDVTDFATPVKMVELAQTGKNVRINISTLGEYEHLSYQTNDIMTVEFRALTKQEKEEIQRRKQVFSGERLSLNFQDIEVRAVLQLLADFTGLNLVTSDTVRGRITLRLQNVPWDQALDIILKSRGLSMRKTDNVVMIAPTEEITARERLELESQKQIEELAPLQSEYIQINYAKASALKRLLKSKDNELLTPGRGNVTVDGRTNTLLVRDTASKLEDIRRLIQRLDIPVRQVMIESRVVIADNNFARELGVRLGFNRANNLGRGSELLVAGARPGTIAGTGTTDSGTFLNDFRAGLAPGLNGTGPENLMVNLAAPGATSGISMLVGSVGSYLLQLELTAMQSEGRGEIISSPRIITADKNKAVIQQGTEIPYATVSNNGTNVQFKEAVLKLEVTPLITPDDRIIMDLDISKDNPNFAQSVQGTPAVDTRSVTTRVLVDNGETVVLGGVFEKETSKDVEKVPFLGDLPILGFFFRQTAVRDANRELLFFVTPKILKESLSLR
ncbi:MAG: type IV pilus secretin PilQ [Gammaproteobacteria bacterium]|nr:type IV pilus secretin PilQ [Gammaproteobacteria bacterium]